MFFFFRAMAGFDLVLVSLTAMAWMLEFVNSQRSQFRMVKTEISTFFLATHGGSMILIGEGGNPSNHLAEV